MPALTVILPFHRVTPFLGPAVRSILNQTMPDFELIVVDNGTGEGLGALGEAGRDARIRLVQFDTNRGAAAAHNAARAQARSELIANMDSDDIALPTRFERQLAVLRAEPRLGLLTTHALVIDETGEPVGRQFTLASERDQRVFSGYSLPTTNPTLMARRAIFEQFPLREDLKVSADYDFFARAIEVHPARALPEILLHYRQHPGQVTASRSPLMILNACIIRLTTARRRAGRDEDYDGLMAQMRPWLAQPPAPAVTYGWFAELALAEGFPLLAVFLARRRVSMDRRAGPLMAATELLGAALRQAPADAIRLLRMFTTGPVRTHGLRPV